MNAKRMMKYAHLPSNVWGMYFSAAEYLRMLSMSKFSLSLFIKLESFLFLDQAWDLHLLVFSTSDNDSWYDKLLDVQYVLLGLEIPTRSYSINYPICS